MAQMLIRPPDRLKSYIKEEAEKIGITVNALVLQVLWNWKNQNTEK